MSDNYLRIIPIDLLFEPFPEAVDAAMTLLGQLAPANESIQVRRTDEIRFLDQGENFERVLCPYCRHDLTNVCTVWMEKSWESRFTVREISLPCCDRSTDLNDLTYEWPAGFARIALEVQNPEPVEWLDRNAQEKIEQVLGCGIRQILAHY